jgi:hypothetical protein
VLTFADLVIAERLDEEHVLLLIPGEWSLVTCCA